MKTVIMAIVLMTSINVRAQALFLEIIYNPPGGFLLDVYNLEPGVIYGIGAKDMPSADPFNTWELISVFEAPATAVEPEGTASEAQRTYTAVNLFEYIGPTVSIVSPANNATVSGDVPLQVAVSDVLPLLTVEAYVGEVLVGRILAGQAGVMNIPSYWFENGEQDVFVHVVNEGLLADMDDDGIAESPFTFQSWASVSLTFDNEVYMTSYSPLYTAQGSITMDYVATTPQHYTFEVFSLEEELLHSEEGYSVNGNINPQWNFTDLNNDPVDQAGYIFSLSYEPQMEASFPPLPPIPTNGAPFNPPFPPGGQNDVMAAGAKIRTTSYFDKGVTVGKYVISYGTWQNTDRNDELAAMNAAVSARVNGAALYHDDAVGAGREAYGTIHLDFSSDPYPIRRNTETSDVAALKAALSDSATGSWLFDGHSGSDGIIHGDDNWLATYMTAHEIAGLLGNTYSRSMTDPFFSASYNRRLLATFITGCSSVNGDLPVATGTPQGIKQSGNSRIKKSAFVGFVYVSKTGATKMNWINRIHLVWLDNGEFDTAISLAVVDANIEYPSVGSWGPAVLGYTPLPYNGNDSR